MKTCPECGCRIERGVCSNCQEEYFIMENQYHEDPYPISQEFIDKAKEQRKFLKDNKRI